MRLGMVGLGKMGANMTRRLMRGDGEEILARIEDEARLFSAALRSNEARAAFAAFLGKAR